MDSSSPSPENWHGYRVTLTTCPDGYVAGGLRVGMEGVCTADLPGDNVFAVLFDEPYEPGGLRWVTMQQPDKVNFARGVEDIGQAMLMVTLRAYLDERGFGRP